ncbi:drug resistance transporter, EmrB/QacA subfamily [Desulfotomaculum nigrificans CO-1-SRB]|uniref:Drug resistance transporter, EmrB/QacA subfamily n=1 Tax=Desulfotomaculum nigrificans (strain DSM 14880 / VKM B-2319 / CO-1-SRB) TaxID=868595 RepID=F6B6Q9_DESCC|nr:DHA2 family efflux MFS transporter permease subunit [Desulfotomaculum nigrificans]AEF95540.1 drug resistance transporter, EmrB/QacA subfamily [Desulfotomaculum nigrificans CO-1-SRB]
MSHSEEKNTSFWLPLFVLVTGAFAAIFNSSTINVAIPKLMTIFGVSSDEIQWVLTGYMLTSAVVIPITGYLGDRFGNKRVFIYSLAIFTLGSVLSSFSWSNNSLIAFRVLQALGGGMIMPISMAIIYRIVPMNMIGLALGVWGMAAVMGPAIGPTLGGYIIDHFNWRLLFLINIPVGILGIILSILTLEETPLRTDTKFDFWGFVTSAAGCFALLLALSQGNKEGWTSFYIVMLFIFSFFTLLLFVLIELNSADPMLDLRLFKNKTFTLSVAIGGLINIGLFGGVFLMPIFTQNLMGLTPYEAGLLLLPASLVIGVMLPISGALFDKFGAKAIGVIGVTIAGLGTLKLHYLSVDTSFHDIIMIMVIRSIGIGLAMMPISTAGMNVVAKHLVGRASSLSNVIRQIFASFGIAILTAVMQNRQIFHYASLSEGVSDASLVAPLTIKQLQGLLGSPDTAIGVLAGLAQKQSLINAIDDSFLICGIFVISAVPLIFFLQDVRKSKTAASKAS